MNRRAGLLFASIALAAAAAVAEWPAPPDSLDRLAARFEEGVTIDRATWSLFRGLRFRGVVLRSPEGETLPLGDVRLRGGEVEAVGASIEFVRSADGWRVPPRPTPTSAVLVLRLRDGRIRYVDEPWGLDVRLDRVAGTVRLGPAGDLVADLAGGAAEKEGRWSLRLAPGEVEAHAADLPLSALRAGVGDTPLRFDLVIRRPDTATIHLRHEARAGGLQPDWWTKAAISTDADGVCRGGLAFALRGSTVSALLGRGIPASGLIHFEGSFDHSPPSSPAARGRLNLPTALTPAGPLEDLIADECVIDSAGIRFENGWAVPTGGRLSDLRFRLDWAGPATIEASARRGEGTLSGEALVEALVGVSIDPGAPPR